MVNTTLASQECEVSLAHACCPDCNLSSFNLWRKQIQACAAGYECTQDVCYTCTPCAPGTYKTFVGDQKCLQCPPGTYNTKVGSFADCALCPEGAITLGVGKASAEDCMWEGTFLHEMPLICICILYIRVYIYMYILPMACQLKLFITTLAHDVLLWSRCPVCPGGRSIWCSQALYFVASTNSAGKRIQGPCQVCPSGGECNGVSLRTAGNLQGARWQASGYRMYLKACPAGYKLVNGTGYEFQVRFCFIETRIYNFSLYFLPYRNVGSALQTPTFSKVMTPPSSASPVLLPQHV